MIGREDTDSVTHLCESLYKYSEADINGMLGFLVDIVYTMKSSYTIHQSFGIPMGTNCGPLLADLSLYSHEADFVQKLLHD